MKKLVKNISAAVLCSSISLSAMAAVESSDMVHINGVYVYGERASRTIAIFTDATGDDACIHGGWINASKPEAEAMYNLALSMYVANQRVVLQYYDDKPDNISSKSMLCELDAIRVHRSWQP
jgi:hypothetical protein